MKHILNSNTFYILSGLSASGKSTFTKKIIEQGIPADAIVSTDTIRKNILGFYTTSDEYGIKENLHGWLNNQDDLFSIINKILEIRFAQRLPTFFDATSLNDNLRSKYVKLAKNYGINSHIIIFDIEPGIAKERLSKRKERFNLDVIEKQVSLFEKTSQFPYTVLQPDDDIVILPNLITTSKLDIVGDTHGLLSETISLLKKKSWNYDEDKKIFFHKDKERKILFLGDAVDRGTESIELLNVIMNTEYNNQGLFILGNHEEKLINSYKEYLKTGLVRGRSFSSTQTLMKFLSLDEKLRTNLYNYLLFTPTHYSLWIDKKTKESVNINLINSLNYQQIKTDSFKIAFGHANCDYYQPYNYTKSHALYGNISREKINGKPIDSDGLYENNFNLGINEYVFFRGHTLNRSKRTSIFSLEEDQAFKGNMVLLDIEKYVSLLSNNNWKLTHQFFEESAMKEKTEFDFYEHNEDKLNLLKKLTEMTKDGLLSDGWKKDENGKKVPNLDGFKIFKYSKKVHFKRLWKTEPLLEKARGLTLDSAGNIIVHPFDKVYNYGEYDVGQNLDHDKKYECIEKLNGFLGCISKHPFKDELILSTTGSLTSDFVGYINDFITPEIKNDLLKYFETNKQTLLFEVIHPEDKHIIEYEPKDEGLWLIGARGLNFNDKPVSEKELDIIGKQLNFKRPFWFEDTLNNIINTMLTNKLEGYMIRDKETDETLMKIKTNYYLITKFLGRMGPKMTSMMYAKPEHFKEHHVDEEFYPIVDYIVKNTLKEDFENMQQAQRVEYVRDIVNDIRTNVNKKSNLNI